MNQKIKIMKPTPELTDDEIVSYMDFGSVLQKRNQIYFKRIIVRWCVGILISGAALLSSILIVQYVQDDGRKPDVTVPQQTITSHATADSVEMAPDSDKITLPDEIINPAREAEPAFAPKSPDRPRDSPSRKNSPAAGNKQTENSVKSENPVTEDVYTQAEPVEGYEALYAYLSSNLSYPQQAMRDSLRGAVTVTFIISTEGKPENIHVKKDIGEAFSQDVIRVIHDMPRWKPATLNGKAVPSRITLPLTFQIEKIKN
jgi:TonB family protein